MTDIRLFRFDLQVDKEPRYETYLVPLGGSVLDAHPGLARINVMEITTAP